MGVATRTSKSRILLSWRTLIWTLILTLAAIGVTFALSCVTPFAALAVALAGTVGLRASLRVMIVVWFANQVIGFGFFHFPRTPNTFLMGLAIGGAAVAATVVACAGFEPYAIPGRRLFGLALRCWLSFAIYEMTLLGAVVFLGDLETFRPAIVAQLGFVNAVSLVGMVALNEIARRVVQALAWTNTAARPIVVT